MRTRTLPPVGLALLACVTMLLASVTPAPAATPISYAPCGDSAHYACGHLVVALDPTGAMPGTITLALRRHRAPVGEAHSAIVALAGGPGQPALPLTEQLAETLGRLAATRDLIVFDQRGVGLSHPLSCHAFERPDLFRAIGSLLEACAAQIGPTRSLYATADTVADIEAIRQAGGYQKLLLYGTSYGTKVAEDYAAAHPEHVEGLVLDSVVTPNGPDPLERSTFAAIPRILAQICALRACAHVTTSPLADLARLLARIRRAPLRGRAIDGAGHAHSLTLTAEGLLGLLLAGDFSSELRAQLVTAVSAAARGDAASLARLTALGSGGGSSGEREDFDSPLYWATSCADQAFPWNYSAPPARRLAEARAAARALPASAFAPFTAANAFELGQVPACAGWPLTAPPEAVVGPLPSVPTLILSGAEDLRTPTSDARTVAALIPGAHLLVVPDTGHSVLGQEPTQCAGAALQALFAGRAVKPCPNVAGPPPPPLPPLRLGQLAPTPGSGGLPGRTLHAVVLSLADAIEQFLLQAGLPATEELGGARLSTGGLRAGWARLAGGRVVLGGYSYVPGVTVSGTIHSGHARLSVGGWAAAHGTLRLDGAGRLAGTLGGSHVSEPANSARSTAIVERDVQASVHLGPGGRSGRRVARRLAGLLARLIQP